MADERNLYPIARLKDNLNKYQIPEHMHGGIIDYVRDGRQPGQFLCAIFNNDFIGAGSRADNLNLMALPGYLKFLVNCVPAGCYGDREAVDRWCARRGLRGLVD